MAQIEFQLSGDDRAACVPLWKTENGNPVAKAFALHIDADIANRRADTALARRGDSSSRRRSGKPFRGMDSAGKIPQGRAPWPSIALAWRSRSLKRPAGSSRTMHRHRHRCWSRTFRPARVREERSFALLASLGKRSSPLPHQYIPKGRNDIPLTRGHSSRSPRSFASLRPGFEGPRPHWPRPEPAPRTRSRQRNRSQSPAARRTFCS
jgi:hypothetical protein